MTTVAGQQGYPSGVSQNSKRRKERIRFICLLRFIYPGH